MYLVKVNPGLSSSNLRALWGQPCPLGPSVLSGANRALWGQQAVSMRYGYTKGNICHRVSVLGCKGNSSLHTLKPPVCVASLHSEDSKAKTAETKEMAPWLTALAAPAEDLVLFPVANCL